MKITDHHTIELTLQIFSEKSLRLWGIDVDYPARRYGRVEHHSTVVFERSTIKIRMSQPITPNHKEFVYNIWHFTSCDALFYREEPICCTQCVLAWNRSLDHLGLPIPFEEHFAVITKKILCHPLVEFRAEF